MKEEEKGELETHIRNKMEALRKDILSYRELTNPIPPDSAIGRLTRMEAIASKSINEAALHNAESTLSKLERALSTIDAPDFGLCKECEEPIPFKRLMIMPETDLCVECAEEMS